MKTFFKYISVIFIFSVILCGFFRCSQESITEPAEPVFKWPRSTPEQQGIDGTIIFQANTEAFRTGFINSIVVVRNGYLIREWYYNGTTKGRAQNIYGASACMISALVGIAIREKNLNNLDQKLLDYFHEYITPDMDRQKFEITIKHLLTMKAGIPHENSSYTTIYNSSNWIRTVLALPLVSQPGKEFHYNTFSVHLLSGILTKTSGTHTYHFAENYLMKPSGITIRGWQRDNQGYYFGGGGLQMTARDMAKIGWIYLNHGSIGGKQILPNEWIDLSISKHTEFMNQSWGEFHNYNFGFLWWIGNLKEYPVFMAIGYAGQFIINIPALNMVIVTTAEGAVNQDMANQQELSVLDLVVNLIFPSVMDFKP